MNRIIANFGFTEDELYFVKDMAELREWYGGYKSYDLTLYNPWSVMEYLNRKTAGNNWMKASENTLIERLLMNTSEMNKNLLSDLIKGESIEVDDLSKTWQEVQTYDQSIWSLLLISGYLPIKGFTKRSDYRNIYALVNPNTEVRMFLTEQQIVANCDSKEKKTTSDDMWCDMW
jgi:hypothetical protein